MMLAPSIIPQPASVKQENNGTNIISITKPSTNLGMTSSFVSKQADSGLRTIVFSSLGTNETKDLTQLKKELKYINKVKKLFDPECNDSSIAKLRKELKQNPLSPKELKQNNLILSNVMKVATENINRDIVALERVGVEKEKIEELKEIKNAFKIFENNLKEDKSISFTGSKENRMIKNHFIIHSAACSAAASAFALAQVPGGDEAALTAITLGMATAICKNYSDVNSWAPSAVLSVVAGKMVGERLAAQIYKYIPGLGNIANALSTSICHESTGWMIVAMLEHMSKNNISDPEKLTKEEIKILKKEAKVLKNKYAND